jgi:hypothetical protein
MNLDFAKYKYKLTFFNIDKNSDQVKLFDNYADWSKLYYMLLGKKNILDLKALKFDMKSKQYREVINV